MLLSYFKSTFANLQYVNNGESHLMRPSIHHFVDVQTTDLEGWYDTIYYLKKPLVAPIRSSNTTFFWLHILIQSCSVKMYAQIWILTLSLDIMKLNFWRTKYLFWKQIANSAPNVLFHLGKLSTQGKILSPLKRTLLVKYFRIE